MRARNYSLPQKDAAILSGWPANRKLAHYSRPSRGRTREVLGDLAHFLLQKVLYSLHERGRRTFLCSFFFGEGLIGEREVAVHPLPFFVGGLAPRLEDVEDTIVLGLVQSGDLWIDGWL